MILSYTYDNQITTFEKKILEYFKNGLFSFYFKGSKVMLQKKRERYFLKRIKQKFRAVCQVVIVQSNMFHSLLFQIN